MLRNRSDLELFLGACLLHHVSTGVGLKLVVEMMVGLEGMQLKGMELGLEAIEDTVIGEMLVGL
jgi:hypothetical protein